MTNQVAVPTVQTVQAQSQLARGSILQRQCACGNHTIAGGECEECKKTREQGVLQRSAVNSAHIANETTNPSRETRFNQDFSLMPARTNTEAINTRGTQPKLTINKPGDSDEQEAEQVVANIFNDRQPTGFTQNRSLKLRRVPRSKTDFSLAPPIVHAVLSTAGQPLDSATRSFMEPRFRQDFTTVRVHTDGQAAASAEAVNAKAYTVGQNIVFGRGQFSPKTQEGKRLIAHELTHVLQQSGMSTSNASREPNTHSVVPIKGRSSAVLARDTDDEIKREDPLDKLETGSETDLKEQEVDPKAKQITGEQNQSVLPGPQPAGENKPSNDADIPKSSGAAGKIATREEATTPQPSGTVDKNGHKTQTPAPSTVVPSKFSRDIDCVEAPPLPTVPTPLPFAPDPDATLPDKETVPDLSSIGSGEPWWGDPDAQSFGEKLAECYASRTANSPKPIEKSAKLEALRVDFDRVVQASFARARKFGEPWSRIGPFLVKVLENRRKNILADEKNKDAKLPKDQRRSIDELNRAVEIRMQPERHDVVEDVRQQVALGTWAWMVERREKLDFDTVKQINTGKTQRLPEILTDPEIRTVVHGILVKNKKELTNKEIEKVIDVAQKAKDVQAKRAKTPSTPLTEDEKAAAIAKAELERVKNSFSTELRMALIQARTKKDEVNLVVPTKADVKGWDPDRQKTRIHKDVVALLKVLEVEFPQGFRAGTYRNNIEGDHASGGFEGRFSSLDMYPNGGTSRIHQPFGEIGFFDKQIAYDFALAIDRAVAGKGTYLILYNDFVVAREVNKAIKNGRMVNVDNVVDAAGFPTNLNWHGPLVTHFHVDFAINATLEERAPLLFELGREAKSTFVDPLSRVKEVLP